MALNTSRTAARRALRCQWNAQATAPTLFRTFSTSRCQFAESDHSQNNPSALTADRPRWAFTPERMKAPFSHNEVQDPRRAVWSVNEDPKKLDAALNSFMGPGGDRLLSEELKWLAVTHKSFDQGRRGFNDRLAYLGRQIAIAEATQQILSSPPVTPSVKADHFAGRREPYYDPFLRSLDNLTVQQPGGFFRFERMAKIGIDTGIAQIIRWKPRMPENLEGSGYHPVIGGALYAIIGAVAAHCGGKAAARIARDRLVKNLQ